jgi:hypothetical protein
MATWAADELAQWQGMMTWIQLRYQKWDALHEYNKLYGVGIMNMIVKVMKCVAPSQEVRERERDKPLRTDGGGLEGSQHGDIIQEVGPVKRQQWQQQLMPKLQLKLQPKLQPSPKQMSATTPA